jgi:hypothetical protein
MMCKLKRSFFCLAISTSAALAQSPSELAPPPNILISASVTDITDITGAEKETARPGAELGLRVAFAEASSASSANGRVYLLSRTSLFQNDGTPKRLEVVVWLDPRHFSIRSNRHGLLAIDPSQSIFDRHVVRALPDPGDANEASPTNQLRLILRDAAPRNETSTVGILLLGNNELIADFSLPLTVTEGHTAPSGATVNSPFRPKTPPENFSDDNGVLTLIELHQGYVQLTFACSFGMRSWRVVNDDSLKDWPKYVDVGIAEAELETAASTFSGLLFPADLRCHSGCASAASLFNVWARHAANVEPPPSLTVQTLPLGKDETFAPVLMPAGVLPISDEAEELLLPEEQNEFANEEAFATPAEVTVPDPALPPELASGSAVDPLLEASGFSGERDATAGEAVAIAGALKDPADPEFEVNRPIAMTMDPVAPHVSQGGPLPLPDGSGHDEHATGYLAYKVVTHLPLHRFTATVPSKACAGAWSILVPPDIEDPDGGLDEAREQMRVLLDIWDNRKDTNVRGSELPFQYERSLTPLKTKEPQSARLTNAWLIVSHYNSSYGVLRMPRASGKPQTVGGDELRRKLAPPGVVLLLACQTAVPATNTFLTHLIANGASTLISTSALLPGKVAGEFATAFMGVLGEAGPAGIYVVDAFRETLRRLPDKSQYAVPRFVLAGDPYVRLCAPPLVR